MSIMKYILFNNFQQSAKLVNNSVTVIQYFPTFYVEDKFNFYEYSFGYSFFYSLESHPPPTTIASPIIYEASSEARNATALPISCGFPYLKVTKTQKRLFCLKQNYRF